jgi:hypothetical protein
MSDELISILILALIFLVATTTGVFKRLMQWGMRHGPDPAPDRGAGVRGARVVIAPPIAWLVLVVPGWL